MDTKIRHLYEVAVITAFTAAPLQAPSESGKESGATVTCQQDPPQQAEYQLPDSQYWTPAGASWNFLTGQDYKSWALSAQVNAARQSWYVENAPSVSNFTSGESISSWGPDAWSRESLVSQESFGNPTYSQIYVNCASSQPYIDSGFMDPETAFDAMTFYDGPNNPNDAWQGDDVTFIPGPIHPDELWTADNSACAFPHSDAAGKGGGTQHNHFEDMLERVAQDLTSLEVNAAHATSWQIATPVGEPYGVTTGASQTFVNGFEDVDIDESQEESYLYPQNFNLRQVHVVRDLSSAVQFEADRRSGSIADSGQVSRASSMTSLAATSSDVSEDNMADMESCESISEQRVKLLKRKLNSSTGDRNINLFNSSLTNERSQTKNPALTNTYSQNIKRPSGSCRSTSSESVASCLLTSDSEKDLKSHINNMSLAEWIRMKREKLQSISSAQHPTEASSSTSVLKPEVPGSSRSSKGCSESVSVYSLSSDSEKDSKSNINSLSLADWTRMKREKLQSTSSVIHPPAAISSTPAWKPELYQNSQTFESFANRPHVYQNPHNELSYWDSGIDNTGNLTHFLDTSNNIFNNTSNVFTYTHYNESTYPTENLQYLCPSSNSYRTCYTNDVAKLPAQEPPPYNCSLDHGSEFIAIRDLDVKMLPLGYQSWEHLNTILQISHRVVKLRVHKQFNFTQHEDNSSEAKSADSGKDVSEEPVLDHYGTGFACHIDKETVVIRTHIHLVASSLEASSTEVTFTMDFPNVVLNHQITCTGVAEGFSSNDYSQTARFVCKTPPDLISYLHLFKDVPVVRNNSLFNDSSYFTDSSPDTSTSGPDELENDHKDITLQKEKQNIHPVPHDTYLSNWTDVCCRPLIGHGNSNSLYSHVLANKNGESLKLTTQKSDSCEENSLKNISAENSRTRSQQEHGALCVNMSTDYEHKHLDSFTSTTNTFTSSTNESLLPDDTRIISSNLNLSRDQAYQSRKYHYTDSLNWNTPEIPWQNSEHLSSDSSSTAKFLGIQQATTVSSPLVIMERRFDVLNAASATRYCPYADQNIFGPLGAFTNFSSFAGDVFSRLALDLTSKSTLKTGDTEDTGKWEYEKLLFLQNQHRDSYNKQHPPAKQGHPGDGFSFPAQDTNEEDSRLSTERSIETQDFEKKILSIGEIAQAKTSTTGSKNRAKLQTPAVDHTTKDSYQSDPHNVNSPSSSSLMNRSSCSSGSTSGSNRRNVFAEFSSVSDYLNTWDRDLLNLDADLSPIQDEASFETMVNNLLQDSDEEDIRLDTHRICVCCPQGDLSKSSYSDPVCIVISHPHGGPKMISVGLFSGHRHIGGILYDTPTCMGSCGAPVIALTVSTACPYLTHFVHSGTMKVNGVSAGAGVAYFEL